MRLAALAALDEFRVTGSSTTTTTTTTTTTMMRRGRDGRTRADVWAWSVLCASGGCACLPACQSVQWGQGVAALPPCAAHVRPFQPPCVHPGTACVRPSRLEAGPYFCFGVMQHTKLPHRDTAPVPQPRG